MKKTLHVGVVMGSNSDWNVMQHAVQVLKDFGVPHEARVVSAHRTPDTLFKYAETAEARGLRCIIARAGALACTKGTRLVAVHCANAEGNSRRDLRHR